MQDLNIEASQVALAEERETFRRDGFLLLPGLCPPDTTERLAALAHTYARAAAHPVEYEADVGYPGAPSGLTAVGGRTIRRVLGVYDRHEEFRSWAASPGVTRRLRSLLGADPVLSRAHHNCIMRKDPEHSSETPWHQDARYWRFARPELISVLVALSSADAQNGCMRFIPGTHTMDLPAHRFDAELALRTDLPENQALVRRAVFAPMSPGDVVFFHCRTLHAADRNRSAGPRLSLIFTYRGADNPPVEGTRSAGQPEVAL